MPAMMVPGKLGLSQDEGESLGGQGRWLLGFFEGGLSLTVDFPLPITSMCAGTVTLMVEVKRLMPYPLTGNQRPA